MLEQLNAWPGLASLPGDGPIEAVDELPGGAQNLLFTLRRADGTELVLRRPGRYAGKEAAKPFQRESTVLTALARTDVPHPHLYAACQDDDIIGAPFSILEKISGFTPKGPLPGRYAADPDWRRAMAFELVSGAATLATVDHEAIGLGGLSRTDDWINRQIARYLRLLEGYREVPDYRAVESPLVKPVADWLQTNQPATWTPGIVHGDFQFANVMFADDAPKLTAIVDWEMASVGDPMIDLAWVLTAWREEGDPPGSDPYIQPWDGMPTSTELIEHWAGQTGRSVADFRWFQVLACFRLASLLEGNFVRALNGKMDRTTGEVMHTYSGWLWAKADLEMNR